MMDYATVSEALMKYFQLNYSGYLCYVSSGQYFANWAKSSNSYLA